MNTKIKGLFLLILALNCLFFCPNNSKSTVGHDAKIKKATVRYFIYDAHISNPGLVSKNKNEVNSFDLNDSFNIYYDKNWTVYELVNRQIFQTDTIVEKIQDHLFHVLSKEGVDYCYVINNFPKPEKQKIKLVDFLRNNVLGNIDFYDKNKMEVVRERYLNDSSELIKICKFKIRADNSFPDTLYYSFKKIDRRIRFSFSNTLDTSSIFKVYKVEFCSGINSQGNFGRERYAKYKKTMSFELIEKEENEFTKIDSLIKANAHLF